MRRGLLVVTIVLGLASLLYAGAVALLWAEQRRFLFVPSADLRPPGDYGLRGFSTESLTTSDGVRVTLWSHAAQAGHPTVVFFHGNGGNLANRSALFEPLAAQGFGILALSYRGYGTSGGSPSEAGFYEDARAVMRYAQATLGLPQGRIVLLGESLGSGVATKMATEFKVAAVVLEAPYTSVADVAGRRFPWVPVDLLLSDRFDSIDRIAAIGAPLLIFHGGQDDLIPVELGRRLFEVAREPKRLIVYPHAGHVDFDSDAVVSATIEFLRANGVEMASR